MARGPRSCLASAAFHIARQFDVFVVPLVNSSIATLVYYLQCVKSG
jgi:hypothetical protein